jgi:hypothetical protein
MRLSAMAAAFLPGGDVGDHDGSADHVEGRFSPFGHFGILTA